MIVVLSLQGEFTFFLHRCVFFSPPPTPSRLPGGIDKNSEVPDRSLGVQEVAHRGPITMGDILDLQQSELPSGTSEFLAIPGGILQLGGEREA